jgi:hypothetical protein
MVPAFLMVSARYLPTLTASLLVFTMIAGCIQADLGLEGEGTSPKDLRNLPLEDVKAAIAAGNTSANVHEVSAWLESGNGEIDPWGDYLAVMKRGDGPRVAVLNVADPEDIFLMDELELPGVHDVKWSADGEYIFVGFDGGLGHAPAGPTREAGVYVVDASDKENLELVHFEEVGPRRGPHMVYYHQQPNGKELIFSAAAEVVIHEFDRGTNTMEELARYMPDPLTGFNRDPMVIDVLYGVQMWAHDMFVMEDPVDNKTLMYVANWDAGLRIVDVTDPSEPVELGGWMDFPDGHTGNLHTVATEWIDDRRITVGSPEVGFAVVGGIPYVLGTEPTGLYVWDTTDPSDIQLLSFWQNPIDPYAQRGADEPFATLGEGLTSSHNLQIEEGRVYMAHYELGVWIIDVSTPDNQTSPPTIGYFFEPGMNTWDVVVNQGVIYLGDAQAIYALHFPWDLKGPQGITSRA